MVEGTLRQGRLLSLTVTHVEVSLYRSSRTSSDPIRKPAHFVYHVRCSWTGDPVLPERRATSPGGQEADRDTPPGQQAPMYWWDPLPSTYVVKRRWKHVEQLHELIDRDLVYDRRAGCRRIKGRMPAIPAPGNLHAFVMGVAETGDAMATRRKKPLENGTGAFLTDIHTIYVENQLWPYFAEVSKVLNEVPAEVLADCAELKKFLVDGASCKHLPLLEEDLKADVRSHRRLRAHSPDDDILPPSRGPVGGGKDSKKSQSAVGASSPVSPHSQGGQASPSPNAASMMMTSASMPSLGDDDDSFRRSSMDQSWQVTREDQRRRRLASSHYGFFAKTFKGPEFGHSSHRDLWQQMRLKERRELGRRTLIRVGRDDDSQRLARSVERLPRLPPPTTLDFRASTDSWAETHSSLSSLQRGKPKSVKDMMQPSSDELNAKSVKEHVVNSDICEGIRVLVLGAPPPATARLAKFAEGFVQERYPDATLKETLKIYELYRHLVEQEEEAGGSDNFSDDEASAGALSPARSNQSAEALDANELLPISWPQIFGWAQRQLDFAVDYRYKSVAAALNRSLRLYWQHQASPTDRYMGVTISLLFQWVWPGSGPDRIAEMLTWICNQELSYIQQPTPRVIDPHERRQLENLFKAMDREGRGYLTAEDLAGGKVQDVESRLKNVVDADTVRAVITEKKIYPTQFLEIMCEDNFRGHEHATKVLLEDGRQLVLQERESVGFSGWVYGDNDVPPGEEKKRRLIDAIEDEVLRWRRLASAKPMPMWHNVGDGQGPHQAGTNSTGFGTTFF